MSEPDVLLERIQSFNRARGGGVVVQKAARGYSLRSERSGAPIARLRPTAMGERVEVLWWNGERWGASGPFGMATMPLDDALDYIASEPAFWIHALNRKWPKSSLEPIWEEVESCESVVIPCSLSESEGGAMWKPEHRAAADRRGCAIPAT
jgi:hypothetical protein